MKNTEFYKVEDVMLILECSKSKAYEIIRKLNRELEEEGYLIRRGYISVSYFKRRYAL